ncbi:MAG TPA: VanW family protein [Miltoncostaea sp.]|nr:VanW family protein [Miltoncostaea sp.]
MPDAPRQGGTGGGRRPRTPAERARLRRRRRNRRLGVLVLVVLLVAVGIGAAIAVSRDDSGAPGAVQVAGVSVDGKDRAEIAKVVRDRAKDLAKEQIVVTRTDDPGFRVAATRAELGARPRVRAAVDEALEPRNIGGRILSGIGIAPTRDVMIRWTFDARKLAGLVRRVTGPTNEPARPASLKVTDDDIVLTPATGGYGIDAGELRSKIADGATEVAVTPGPLTPAVSDEAATAARAEALALVAEPAQVTFAGNGVPIEPAVLREALRFHEDPPELRVALDPDVLYADIKDAFSTREQPYRDATFKVNGGTVRIVGSRIGRSLDMRTIAQEIVDAPGTAVRARFKVTRPERTTAELKTLGIKEEISEFTTPYNCCEPRVTNIQRAAQILDGTIIPAGNTFSLNDALGPRTEARGFVSAPQIAAGQLEDAIGGGVSQVATTMYNAAFFGGMDLIAHTPHQFWISRYPKGREATVSWGGPELVFRNDWDAAVLVSVSAGSNSITVRMFSSKLGREVETETGEPTDVKQPETKEEKNPDLPPGTREVKQELGGPGFTIGYTRKVLVNGDVKRDETFHWTYDPQDAFIEVGPEKEKTTTGPRRDGTTTAPGDTTSAPETPDTPATPPARTQTQPQAPPAPGGAAPPPPG